MADLILYERRKEAKRDYASNIEWMTAAAVFGFASGGEKIPVRPISEAFRVESKDERLIPHAEQTCGDIRDGIIGKLSALLPTESENGVTEEDGTVQSGCEDNS